MTYQVLKAYVRPPLGNSPPVTGLGRLQKSSAQGLSSGFYPKALMQVLLGYALLYRGFSEVYSIVGVTSPSIEV